jgi:hypothetical protein
MGQQQLLLLIAGVVIVGLATIVGIRASTESSTRANNDAMLHDAVSIATIAQAWKRRPNPLGGQPDGPTKQDVADYSDLSSFESLGYASVNSTTNPLCYENINGVYALTGADDGLTITGYNAIEGNLVTVAVDGVTDASITQGTILIGSAAATDAPAACP